MALETHIFFEIAKSAVYVRGGFFSSVFPDYRPVSAHVTISIQEFCCDGYCGSPPDLGGLVWGALAPFQLPDTSRAAGGPLAAIASGVRDQDSGFLFRGSLPGDVAVYEHNRPRERAQVRDRCHSGLDPGACVCSRVGGVFAVRLHSGLAADHCSGGWASAWHQAVFCVERAGA